MRKLEQKRISSVFTCHPDPQLSRQRKLYTKIYIVAPLFSAYVWSHEALESLQNSSLYSTRRLNLVTLLESVI